MGILGVGLVVFFLVDDLNFNILSLEDGVLVHWNVFFFFSNQTGSLRFCWILILPFKNWIFKVLFGKSNLSTLFTNQLSEAMRDVNSMNGRDVRIHHSPFVELETDMDVSENNGTPKTSILIGFSKINHPFWGTPIFQKPPDIQ